MQKKLKWNAVGLEARTVDLQNIIRMEKEKINNPVLREYKKLQLMQDDLSELTNTMQKIKTNLIPYLEKIFHVQFKTPELILFALSRPSIKNLFNEIKIYLDSRKIKLIKEREFVELAASGEAANVLALVGDAALGLAVVESQWDSSLATIGELTRRRSELVKNENLARICDVWGLYQYRLKPSIVAANHMAKPETIIHEKGTLVEAIIGVIYLEFGYEELLRIIPVIQ
jgi:dsRNA-specific ribonuclease